MTEPSEVISRLTKITAVFNYPDGKAAMKALQVGHEVILVREPSNPYDANAIQVWARSPDYPAVRLGPQLGYIPKEVAANLKDKTLLGAEKHHSAWDAIVIHYKE